MTSDTLVSDYLIAPALGGCRGSDSESKFDDSTLVI